MNPLKVGIAALLLGIAASATVAQAQDVGVRRPQAPRTCYDPSGSRACQPGPAVDVAALIPALRGGRTGLLRLNIEPSTAEVYVDNIYAGTVREFDGNPSRVALTPGSHRVEVRAPGRSSLQFNTRIHRSKVTFHHGTLPAAR